MKSILLSIVGLILGAVTNGLLVQLGDKLIAAPEGLDLSTEAGLKAAMAHFWRMPSVPSWVLFS
jgi:hypothetical protein